MTFMHKRRKTDGEITIRDVATAASVSMMTVSNVVNGRFDQMAPKTRARVENAIQTLSYRPHLSARNLRKSERLSIGLLFIDDEETFLTHPGHSYVVAGLSSFLNEREYSLTLQGVSPHQLSKAIPLKSIGTDGLCIVQSGPAERRAEVLRAITQLSQPCVLIHETKAVAGDFCIIREADREGGHLLARHMIERGCKDLLLVLPTTIWTSMEERALGVRAACKRAKIPLSVVRTKSSAVEDTDATLRDYFRDHDVPAGIIAGNDQIGIGTLQFLKSKRIGVPGRVRVTGFNAFELWKYSDPRLTTVRAPATSLGNVAGKEIVQRLTTGRFSSNEIVLPVEMIIGAST